MGGGYGRDVQPEGHGAVIHERYLHIGSEFASGNEWMACLCRGDEMPEEPGSLSGGSRRRETWPQAVTGVCGEGELRHEQQAPGTARTIDACYGPVHFASAVTKYAVTQDLGEQFVSSSFGIAALGAYEDK